MDCEKRAILVVVLCCAGLIVSISGCKREKPRESHEERLHRETKIAFTSHKDGFYTSSTSFTPGYSDIYVVNVDGSEQQKLTTADGWFFPTGPWSPDGKRIVFYSNRDATLKYTL